MDGSCYPHYLSGLSRAAWAIVLCGSQGERLVTINGTVPAMLPQTSPVAEGCAYLAYLQYTAALPAATDLELYCSSPLVGHNVGYTDCKLVHDLHQSSVHKQLAHKTVLGGLFRQAMDERPSHQSELVKVKAHADPAALEGLPRYMAICNGHADTSAKAAWSYHISSGLDHAKSWQLIDDMIRDHAAAVAYAARVACTWPTTIKHMKQPITWGSKAKLALAHAWHKTAGTWRCRQCARLAYTARGKQRADQLGCGGLPPNMLAAALRGALPGPRRLPGLG